MRASTDQQFPFIDVARALAPLIVLWVHIALGWCRIHESLCSGWILPRAYVPIVNQLRLYDFGAHVGVLLFFLVSGFIISHVATIESRREFVLKRIFRIVPMMVIGVAATYASSSILIRLGLEPTLWFGATSYHDLLRSMFLLDWFFGTAATLTVTWTLVAEISFYTMMTVAYVRLSRAPITWTFALIAITAAIDSAMVYASGGSMAASFYFMQVEFIFVGRAIYLFCSGRSSFLMSSALGFTAIAALTGLYMMTPYSRSVIFNINSVAYSWVFTIAIFCWMIVAIKRCPAVLRFFSNISYSVYMLHIAVGSLVLNVICARFGIWIGWSFWMASAAIIACSYLCYIILEQPSRDMARIILRRNFLAAQS